MATELPDSVHRACLQMNMAQLEADRKQRVALVEWIAQIDERQARLNTENEAHLAALEGSEQ